MGQVLPIDRSPSHESKCLPIDRSPSYGSNPSYGSSTSHGHNNFQLKAKEADAWVLSNPKRLEYFKEKGSGKIGFSTNKMERVR